MSLLTVPSAATLTSQRGREWSLAQQRPRVGYDSRAAECTYLAVWLAGWLAGWLDSLLYPEGNIYPCHFISQNTLIKAIHMYVRVCEKSHLSKYLFFFSSLSLTLFIYLLRIFLIYVPI